MDIFNNDDEVLNIGNLSIENQLGSVLIHGDVQIGTDDIGRMQAQALYEFATKLLQSVNRAQDDGAVINRDADSIDNPFG